MPQDTLLTYFSQRVKETPEKPFLHQPYQGNWTSHTWQEVDTQARQIANGLITLGLNEGERVAIFGKNCAEWIIAELGISMAGLVSVPIYYTANADTVNYVLQHSECKVVFVGQHTDADVLHKLPVNLPYISFQHTTLPEHLANKKQWQPWLNEHSATFTEAIATADDTYTIMYTSGSTGVPKGVVLSHRNVTSAASATASYFPAGLNRVLSYLPLAHVTERSVVAHTAFYIGSELYFNESLETFVDDLNYCRPTVFLSVPRLWSKFQAQIVVQIPDKKLQRLLSVPLLGRFVSRKIRKKLGFEHCKSYLCGSAPMPPALLEWFYKLGIPIGEGWGMTETAGAACVNLPFDKNRIGTIGAPFEGVELRIADNGELLIRGDCIFDAYYLEPEKTSASFDNDWFKTGDRAEQTPDGAWKIIGRVKEQFKTAKGKYVSPAPIESMLAQSTLIEQCCVVGNNLPQPIALVVLAELDNPNRNAVTKELEQSLKATNETLESHEQLNALVILNEAFSIENELLTPTLKMKRDAIEKSYQHLIESDHKNTIVWESLASNKIH